MNFYLEVKSTGRRLYFPIIPDKVNITSGANTVPINIIKSGENKIPRGVKATGYTWTSTLPGKSMKGQSFVIDWQAPKTIIALIEEWKTKHTELKFVVGKFINDDVFVEVFNRELFGQGHCKYNITLTKQPNLTVTTSPAPKTKSSGTSTKKGTVTGKKVTFRKGAGKSYKKLGTIKKGTTVTIYSTSGNWYMIKKSGSDPDSDLKKGMTSGGSYNKSDEWWICSSYVKVGTGSSDKTKKSSGRKASASHGSGHGSSGGKKKLTGTAPKTGLVNPKPTVQKPASQKPLKPGERRDMTQ